MTDEDPGQSKRERQKQRLAEKRAEQERRKQQDQRKRRLTIGALAVVVVAAVAGGVLFWQAQRADRGELLAASAEPAEAAGCQPVEEPEDMGADHFPGQPDEALAALEQAPPEEIYDHRPATSGTHIGLVAATGIYDSYVDERLLLHNLEHGYVVLWYDPDLDEGVVAEIEDWADGAMGAANDHLIVSPYNEALPDGGNVALVTWDHRQLCDEFSPEVADAFVGEHADNLYSDHGATDAHDGSLDSELVPGEDEVVFPPHPEASGAPPGAPADAGATDEDEG
ncbi:DUF3105 domain-containing protein [Egibacter rhizosphaerae]|uniref:DUF3105 domain-containing protein n=1 Tax=Egibacter rhizosphaerae TaxID=1670831 RepID=A0A411YGX6_9ACTN|nr:DUF3105 domain-containing protein [Egibacter rhizosphaerae]QBI20575.1 DUF3105 domain-containing protein [Egibacter rhizosphaerae]